MCYCLEPKLGGVILLLALWSSTSNCQREAGENGGSDKVQAKTVCEVFRHPTSFQNRMVRIRGIYFHGLRAPRCSFTIKNGEREWPPALSLADSQTVESIAFQTDHKSWENLDRIAQQLATTRRFGEVWVTATGVLKGPYVVNQRGERMIGAFGMQGMYPAELVVLRFEDIEIVDRPTFDYVQLLPPRLDKR